MRTCDGCRFCCWAWSVDSLKAALRHCPHECADGCAIYSRRPVTCGAFHCPYLERAGFHRPDTFQLILEELCGDIGNYIPTIPQSIPPRRAEQLIRESQSVLAAVISDDRWLTVALPLRRNSDGSWQPNSELNSRWQALCDQYA